MSQNKSKAFFSQKIVYPKGLGNWVDLYKQPFRPPSPSINKPKTYDGQNIKTLTSIHEQHSRFYSRFSKKIDEKLNTQTEFSHSEFQHIEEKAVLNLIQSNHLVIEYKLRSLGSILLAIPLNTCSLWLNKVFGGPETVRNELSSLEKKVLPGRLAFMPELLSKTWQHIFNPNDIETIQHLDNAPEIESNNKVPVMSLFTGSFLTDNHLNTVHLIYPNALIKTLHNHLSTQVKTPKNKIELNEETCEGVNVPVIATLGTTEIILNDILNLQIGDVVVLDNEISDPVTLSAGDLQIPSQVGSKDDQICVQLLSEPKEETHPVQSLFKDVQSSTDVTEASATPESSDSPEESLENQTDIIDENAVAEHEMGLNNTLLTDASSHELNTPEANTEELTNTDLDVDDLDDLEDMDNDFDDFDDGSTPEETSSLETTIDDGDDFLNLDESDDPIADETPEAPNEAIDETMGDLSDDDDDDFSWDDLDDI